MWLIQLIYVLVIYAYAQVSLLIHANFTCPSQITFPATGIGEKLINYSRWIGPEEEVHRLVQIKDTKIASSGF
jgi:hypothetical protein